MLSGKGFQRMAEAAEGKAGGYRSLQLPPVDTVYTERPSLHQRGHQTGTLRAGTCSRGTVSDSGEDSLPTTTHSTAGFCVEYAVCRAQRDGEGTCDEAIRRKERRGSAELRGEPHPNPPP